MLRMVTKKCALMLKTGWSGKTPRKHTFRERWLSTGQNDKKIEVEVKFPFSKVEEDKIQSISKLISIKRFTDDYFDDSKYTLTSKDIWLRRRDDKWECKTTTLDFDDRSSSDLDKKPSLGDRYHEIEKEGEIIGYLHRCRFLRTVMEENSGLHQILLKNGYAPFCTIETTRKKYQYQDLTIDLDSTDFGYQIGEIEIVVASEDQILTAEEKIHRFAKELSLNINSGMPGKVLTYLQCFRPEHYRALRNSGLLDAKRIK